MTVGVDTHKYVHVAVALDAIGGTIATASFAADSSGYQQLSEWAVALGEEVVFGVEGTGAYGAGLAAELRRRGLSVVEVLRPDRAGRRRQGKSDTLDAENAARALLAGHVRTTPKTADGVIEMIRLVKVAKDNAVKARSTAMTSLKTVLVTAPAPLREQLQPLTRMALIRRCAALRPGPVVDVAAASKYTLRAIAKRWLELDAEVTEHERVLTELATQVAPELIGATGIGPDSAAELLIVVGDNAGRVRSEAAFARLCGVAPIPASSGMTTRHRLSRGGHRHANAALYRAVLVRMQYHEPTRAYVARRTLEGKTRRDIIRCLKRLLAREVWHHLQPLRQPQQPLPTAA